MNALTESVVEQATLDWFPALRRRRSQEPGALQDAGNNTTLAHYLDLLASAGMLSLVRSPRELVPANAGSG